MILSLLALANAYAWPADDAWLTLNDGSLPLGDATGDALPDDPSLDLVGEASNPVAHWYADDEALYLRLRVAADPQVSPGVFRAQVYGFLVEADGDAAFEYALISESAAGDLRAYPNEDGLIGTQPGFASYGQPWSLGDLATGSVRRQVGTGSTFHVDLRVTRLALDLLGIGDDAPIRLTAVTGPSIYVDWADLSSCNLLPDDCPALTEVQSAPIHLDRDFDGVTDAIELTMGTHPDDADSDDDGVPDGQELPGDADGDGLINALDCDADDDGLPDSVELGLTADDLGPGTDAHSTCFVADTDPSTTSDPFAADTDGGGLDDGLEDWNHNGAVDPWETDPNALDDADADGDSIADVLELLGVDGEIQDVDSDGDGIPDADEWLFDRDGDGVPNFLDDDSDGDGIPDAIEGNGDTDGDGAPDYLDLDSDDDGIPDAVEGQIDSDADGIPDSIDSDSDGDGLPDAFEGGEDTDGDGVPDFLDLDSDDDGLPDATEGTGDADDDGIPNAEEPDSDDDGIPDAIEGDGDPDLDGIPNFEDTNSDGEGPGDRSEGLGDDDCDGIPNFVDTDEEDSFCDETQPNPPISDPLLADPSTEDPVFSEGHFTGGSCSMSGTAGMLWAPLLFAMAAIRRRRKVVAAGLVLSTTAAAQEINAQRMMPSVDGQHFVKVEDLVLGDAWTASGAAWIGYAESPFVYRSVDGDRMRVLGSVTTTNITAAYSFGRFRIGADLPIHLYTTGYGIERPTHLGDARVSAKGDIYGFDVGPGHLRLGAVADLVLPTGDPNAYVGSGRTWLRTQVVGQWAWDKLQVAGNLGFRTGTGDTFGDLAVKPGLVWGLGGSYAITSAFSAALELDGDVWFGNGSEPGAVPMEWLGSGRYHLTEQWTVMAGVGTGLSQGVGAPDFRAIGGIRWRPFNRKGAVAQVVERVREVPAPVVPGPATLTLDVQTPWGSPVEGAKLTVNGSVMAEASTDRDGRVSLVVPPGNWDVAVRAVGYRTQAAHLDLRPDVERELGLYLRPEEVVVDTVAKRVFLNEKIFFELDKAELKLASLKVLDQLVVTLVEHPDIERLRIEGHTDSQGTDEHNDTLSEARANAVLDYLVSQGIDAKRLVAQGFGESRLLQHGDSEDVHATNRRVELHIETLAGERTSSLEQRAEKAGVEAGRRPRE